MSIVPTQEGNTVTVKVEGSMDLSVYAQLHDLAKIHYNNSDIAFIFDFNKTRYLHDSGIATLISFQNQVGGKSARMKCINCGPQILQSFTRTQNTRCFKPESLKTYS